MCDTGLFVAGAGWHSDNTIIYCDVTGGGVKRVPADGGTPELLLKEDLEDASKKDGIPVDPQILPDGKALLFSQAFSVDGANDQIAVLSLKSGERKVLIRGTDARYLPTGHLLYSLINNNVTNIVAVPFKLDTLEVKGGPVPLLEGILGSAFSDSGTLVYVSRPAGAAGAQSNAASADTTASGRTLVWVDRKGREETIKAPPNDYGYPQISPDGTRIALTAEINGNADIWIWDLVRNTLTRLTFDSEGDLCSLWTADGKRIIFSTVLGARNGIYWKSADGTGEEERLASSDPPRLLIPYSLSRDGKALVFTESELVDKFDISMLSMEGDRPIKRLLQAAPNESHPRVSPDGRWLAYCSEESGQVEVYVRPFPNVNGGKWQVSTNGGNSPRWSPDSRELFYLTGRTETEAAMVVPVETEPTFKPGTPAVLFRGKYLGCFPSNGIPWDIHPDGKRFLMMKPPAATEQASSVDKAKAAGPRKINIVLNWFEELKQRVPVK